MYKGVHRENGWRAIDGSMVHNAMEDVEGEFKRYPARSVPTFPVRCDLDLVTLIGAGEQRFKELAFELG